MDKLFRYINPKTVVDVGANVGDFTTQIVSKFPTCQCMMIEANPYCEPFLKKSTQPYQIIALSDKEGYRELFVEKQNKTGTGASIYKENTQWYSEGMYDTVTVPTSTLDTQEYFRDKEIDLLKLDVQGSELDILNGGEKTLQRTNFVLAETSLTAYNQEAPLIDKVIDKMLECNFRIVDIIEYRSFNEIIFQLDILFKRQLKTIY